MPERSAPASSANPPPPRARTDQIRDMDPGDTIYFDEPAASVRVTVSRVSAEYVGRRLRKYQTAREGEGTRVWRLK